MKKLIFVLVFISPYFFINAQSSQSEKLPESSEIHRGNGRILGSVLDGSTKEPVEYATVALNDSTGKVVDGTVCDSKGKFSISKLPYGSYQIVISFIGFETYHASVIISDKKDDINIGAVSLSVSTQLLGEVTVEGQKALVEERVDRTIYNAESDATTNGGDATDVLKRVPMLSVDLDGNVSMRGNQNVRVLINNKPSTISASSIADALKQIPAEQIKSVEVITSPSAKYDAEGTAGIINIITKKNTLQGATLNVNGGLGIRGSNLGLNGNYKKGKLGLSLGGWGRMNYNIRGEFENHQRTSANGYEILNRQEAATRNRNMFGNYTIGLDYDINKKSFITGSMRFGLRNGNNYQDNLLTQTLENDILIRDSLRNIRTFDRSGTTDINIGYTYLFAKPLRELSVMTLYSRNNRSNDFENFILDESDHSLLGRNKNQNKSYNEEITFQVDYQTPFGNNQLLEIGGKEILRNVSSDYQYFTAIGPEGIYIPRSDFVLDNTFTYNQNISSAYASYTYNTSKSYSVKGGVRYEYTIIAARFKEESEIAIPSYGVVVPSLNVSKKLKNGNTLKIAYNRRIQRPSIQLLNPNLQAPNPLNATIGNPSLGPEHTNNYELSYSTLIKGSSLNFSTFMRNTRDAIQSVRDVIGADTIRTTYLNIGRGDSYGMSIFANVNIGGKFTLNGGTDVYYAILNNNDLNPLYRSSNKGWVASYRLFGSYELKKGWAIQLFGFYRARQVQLQGFQGGFGTYSASLKKELNQKRGSIGLGAENFLTPVFKIRNTLNSPIITQASVSKLYNMNFRINFTYTIGKMSFDNQSKRKKRSINNDDLKDGDNNGTQDNPSPSNSRTVGQTPMNRNGSQNQVQQTQTK